MIDEKPSEPPHCRPTHRWLAETVWRFAALASGSSAFTASMPASMVFRVPPLSCMMKVCSFGPGASPSCSSRPASWLRSQPSPMIIAAARLGWRA